jgi:hypothetical protein
MRTAVQRAGETATKENPPATTAAAPVTCSVSGRRRSTRLAGDPSLAFCRSLQESCSLAGHKCDDVSSKTDQHYLGTTEVGDGTQPAATYIMFAIRTPFQYMLHSCAGALVPGIKMDLWQLSVYETA